MWAVASPEVLALVVLELLPAASWLAEVAGVVEAVEVVAVQALEGQPANGLVPARAEVASG